MAYYEFALSAGVPHPVEQPGTIVLIDSIGVAQGVDVTLIYQGGERKTMKNRTAGFKYIDRYDSIKFLSAVDTVVSVFMTSNDVSLGFANGAAVNVAGTVNIGNDAAHRVPVDIGGGTVNVTASAVTIGNNNAAAIPVQQQALAVIVDKPALSVGIAALLVSNDPTLKRLRFRNEHATARVGLGGAGVTLATAAIILEAGDFWQEDDAAGAAWYAISDTPATDFRVAGLK